MGNPKPLKYGSLKEFAIFPLLALFAFSSGCKPTSSGGSNSSSSGSGSGSGGSGNSTVTTINWTDPADPSVKIDLNFDNALQITQSEINRVETFLSNMPPEQLRKIKHIDFHPTVAQTPLDQATGDAIILNIGSLKDGGSFDAEDILADGLAQFVYNNVLTASEQQQFANISPSPQELSTVNAFRSAYNEFYVRDSQAAMSRAQSFAISPLANSDQPLEQFLFIASLFANSNHTLTFYKSPLLSVGTFSASQVPYVFTSTDLTIAGTDFEIQNGNIVAINGQLLPTPAPVPPILYSRLSAGTSPTQASLMHSKIRSGAVEDPKSSIGMKRTNLMVISTNVPSQYVPLLSFGGIQVLKHEQMLGAQKNITPAILMGYEIDSHGNFAAESTVR